MTKKMCDNNEGKIVRCIGDKAGNIFWETIGGVYSDRRNICGREGLMQREISDDTTTRT